MTTKPWTLSEQFALSFDGAASPALSLRGQADGQPDLLPSSWGVAWYAENQRSVVLVRDSDLPPGAELQRFLDRFDEVRSPLFLGHTHGLHWTAKDDTTQPFRKSYAGRQWTFTGAGELDPSIKSELALDADFFDIVPVGASAEEHAFSWLIAQVRSQEARTIDEYGWQAFQELLVRLNDFGPISFLISDGVDLVAYRDARDEVPLHWSRMTPPHEKTDMVGRAFAIDLDGPMDVSRTVLTFSTMPMRGSRWTPLEPGELRAARRGAIVWSSHPAGLEEHHYRLLGAPNETLPSEKTARFGALAQQQHAAAPIPPRETSLMPEQATLSVSHVTTFRYSSPVERSSHRFCLEPVLDARQKVLEHSLEVSVDGVDREFEDVFGNRSRLLEVMVPYEEMKISSHSTVRVESVLASQLKSPLRRDQIPLVWMPWQRQMMQAYLMPPELPEPELRELSEFAMSFVERNDYDLVETILDLNRTIYRDFKYVSGSTTVETTPFQVYSSRQGVCQDFANVLICVARLLSVPARYRVGYIYTGGNYENKIQSDASHAWAEVYLPWSGWFGFDPTNGCLAGADHVRIACGRHFRDAAPTTGTIYRGGGRETLSVDVRVERQDEVDATGAAS